jgi:hypothetical protein
MLAAGDDMAVDWQGLRQRIFPQQPQQLEDPEAPYLELARAAQRELDAAYSQFCEASDHDLVDHAIFRLQAAERHYIYLLRQVREAKCMSSEGGAGISSSRG